MANEYTGILTNAGGTITRQFYGAVNATHIIDTFNETCNQVYVDSIQYSNTADFAALVNPTAGKVEIYFSTDGIKYNLMQSGKLVAKNGQDVAARAAGDILFIKLVTTGIVGAGFIRIKVKEQFHIDASLDPRVYSGVQALTVQPFTESNCKNGVQYEASAYNPALGVGASQDIVLVTGNQPVLIKSRQIGFDNDLIVANIYKNPTYSGGTPLPYYNLADIDPVTGQMVLLIGASVTVLGSQIGATTYAIGDNVPGSANNGSFGAYVTGGLERVLAPDSTYLFRITNSGTETARVSVYATWYEGPLSSQT